MNQTPYVKRVSLTRRMEPTQIQRSNTRATNGSPGEYASLEACLIARPSPTHTRPTTNNSRALIRETLALSSQDLNDRRSWVLGCRVAPTASASFETATPPAQPQVLSSTTSASSPPRLFDPSRLRNASNYAATVGARGLWRDTVAAFTNQPSRSTRLSATKNADEEDSAAPPSKQHNERQSEIARPMALHHAAGTSVNSSASRESLASAVSAENPSGSEQSSFVSQPGLARSTLGAQSSLTLTSDFRCLNNMGLSTPLRPEGMSTLVTLTRDASLPNMFLRPAHSSGTSHMSGAPSSQSDRNHTSLSSYITPSAPPLFPPAPQTPAPMPLSSRAGVYWPRVSEQQKLQVQPPVFSSGDLSQRITQLLDQSCSAANPEGIDRDSLPFIFHLAALLNEISQTGVWSKMALAHELAKVVCREQNGFYTEAPVETQLRRSYIVYETFALALTSVFASPVARHVSCYSTFIHANSVKQWQVPSHIPDGDSSLDQVYSFIDFHRTSLTCHFLKATQGPPEYAAHIPHLGKIIEMLVTQGPENAQTALVAFLVASRTYFKLLAAIELPGICDLLLSLLGVNPLIPSSLIATQIVDALERQCFSRYHTSVNRSQSSSTLADDKDSSDNSTAGDLRDGSKSDEGGDSHSINFYTAIGLAAKDTIARWKSPATPKRQLIMKSIPHRRLRDRFLPIIPSPDKVSGLPPLSTTVIGTLQHFGSHVGDSPPLSMRRQEWTSWSGDESTSLLSDASEEQQCPLGEWKSGANKHKRRRLQSSPQRDFIVFCESRKSMPFTQREQISDSFRESLVRGFPRRRAFSVDAVWLQSDVYPPLVAEIQRTFSLEENGLISRRCSRCSSASRRGSIDNRPKEDHAIPVPVKSPRFSLSAYPKEKELFKEVSRLRKFRLTQARPRPRCRKRRQYYRCWPQRDPEKLLPSSQRYLIALSRFLLRLLDGSIAILASLPSNHSTDVDDVRPLPSASSDSSEPRHPQLILLQRVFSSSLVDHMSNLLSLVVADGGRASKTGRDKHVKEYSGGLMSSRSDKYMRRRRHTLRQANVNTMLSSTSFLVAEAFLIVLSELSQAVASTTFCLSWSLRNKLLQIIPKVETFLQCAVRHICRLPTLDGRTLSRRQALSSQLPLKTTDCINHILNIFVNLQASEGHLRKHLVLATPTIQALKILFVSLKHSWELARIRSGRVLLALIKRLDQTAFSILRSRKFMTLLLDRLHLALKGNDIYFCCLGPSLDFFIQLLVLCQQRNALEVSKVLVTYPQWEDLEPALRSKLQERPSTIDPSSMVPLEETRKLRDFRKLEERTERARRQLIEASSNKDTDGWGYDLGERLISFPRLHSLDLRASTGSDKPISSQHTDSFGASRSVISEDNRSKSLTSSNSSLNSLRALHYPTSSLDESSSKQVKPMALEGSEKSFCRTVTGVMPASPSPLTYSSNSSGVDDSTILTPSTPPTPTLAAPLVTEELSFRARASRSLQLVRQLQQRQ